VTPGGLRLQRDAGLQLARLEDNAFWLLFFLRRVCSDCLQLHEILDLWQFVIERCR